MLPIMLFGGYTCRLTFILGNLLLYIIPTNVSFEKLAFLVQGFVLFVIAYLDFGDYLKP